MTPGRIGLAWELAADIVNYHQLPSQEIHMTLTVAHLTPLVALIAGILILLVPRLLNYIVAIYLIIVGITGLNSIHDFIR
jgi:hypothetical protein